MIFDRTDKNPGARLLLLLACLVIVVAGLKVARPILVPFILALFLAVVSMPVMFTLRMRRVPVPFAIGLTMLLDLLIFGVGLLIVSNALGDLNQKLPRYISLLRGHRGVWMRKLEEYGIPASTYLNVDLGDPERIFAVVSSTVQAVAGVFAVAFLIVVIMTFILAEATVFPYKFQAIVGGSRSEGRLRISHIIQEIQVYLGLKFIISLATGVVVTNMSLLAMLDFPILLGLIAFVLNFVPTVGSIIAAVPGVALALILHGEMTALFVALGYMAINTVIGNFMDPHIMGHRMGLSTLVVVLSLLFWGWVWGPIGALLSVPLTMVTKISLQNVPDLRWIAILLDKVPPQAHAAAERARETLYTTARVGEEPIPVPPTDPTGRVRPHA
jgi:predicted PurR-regulated permease PerM